MGILNTNAQQINDQISGNLHKADLIRDIYNIFLVKEQRENLLKNILNSNPNIKRGTAIDIAKTMFLILKMVIGKNMERTGGSDLVDKDMEFRIQYQLAEMMHSEEFAAAVNKQIIDKITADDRRMLNEMNSVE